MKNEKKHSEKNRHTKKLHYNYLCLLPPFISGYYLPHNNKSYFFLFGSNKADGKKWANNRNVDDKEFICFFVFI